MHTLLRSAVRGLVRSPARPAPASPRRPTLSRRDVALIERVVLRVHAQMRARGAGADREETDFLVAYTGIMLGVVVFLAYRQFNPPDVFGTRNGKYW